jgi:hypothetical protein
MRMTLPPAFSDQRALQEVYALFRVNGLCAIAVLAAMLLLGRLTDVADAGGAARVRYAIMITLPLAWMAAMVGGAFLVEARRLQLWLRTGPTEGFGTMVARNLAIVFGIVGINLFVIGLAACCLVCWLAMNAGVLV